MKHGARLDYEALAREALPPEVYDYFAGGSGREEALRRNVAAFGDVGLVPRVLRGAGTPRLEIELLGRPLSMPVVIAPTAFHRLATPEGEVATARAARRAGTLTVISMASTVTVDEILERGGPGTDAWFQLYVQPDRGFTRALIERATNAGCRALVVTVDSPVFATRERDVRNGFRDLPDGLTCPNMVAPPGDGRNGEHPRPIEFDPTLTWDDVDDVRAMTDLPVLLKGVLHPEDARIAVESDVAGIFVSNHGGRQLDGGLGAIEALPAIAEEVGGRMPVLFDGGVRRGTDVLKALALGADAVAIGRPVLWGLAARGEDGALDVLERIRSELSEALALCGCGSPADLSPELLRMRGPRWTTVGCS